MRIPTQSTRLRDVIVAHRGVPSETCKRVDISENILPALERMSREIEVHYALWQTKGVVVPVFLGPIGLAIFYFLQGACGLRYMLIMALTDEPIHKIEHDEMITREIAGFEIRLIGALHQDIRLNHVL